MMHADREERVKMMDARNWTAHLESVTGATPDEKTHRPMWAVLS